MTEDTSQSIVPQKQRVIVGGIPVHLYQDPHRDERLPVVAVFLLHGRLGHSEGKHLQPTLGGLFGELRKQREAGQQLSRDLMVITLRNHGWRKLSDQANEDWETGNERHALDMYATQTGTARDVSFLIDFLPSYLYPSGERHIVEWGVIGISLGGHSTWILLHDDARVTFGVPIIGCPDFEKLMAGRVEKTFGAGTALDAPRYPESLRALVAQNDPARAKFAAADASNAFYGKSILVLSGAADELVPWSASKEFVDGLNVGPKGSLRVVVEEGKGHTLTPNGIAEAAVFVASRLQQAPRSSL